MDRSAAEGSGLVHWGTPHSRTFASQVKYPEFAIQMKEKAHSPLIKFDSLQVTVMYRMLTTSKGWAVRIIWSF